MSEQFSQEISDQLRWCALRNRICNHMNEDHANAVVLYAQVFGNSPDANAAQMLSIDAQGMNLIAQFKGASASVRIEFERTLVDSEDAHHTLIAMVKQARTLAK